MRVGSAALVHDRYHWDFQPPLSNEGSVTVLVLLQDVLAVPLDLRREMTGSMSSGQTRSQSIEHGGYIR